MNQRETAFADMDARVAGNEAREASAPQRHIGRSIERLEDPAILTGHGRYGDDIAVKPGTLHAAILRSPHAHADILSIDTQAASKLAGVRAVLTRDDLRPWSRPFVVGVKSPMEQWALAMDRVRYVGEPVAVVMAESRALAEDALDLIKVDYAMLDPVTSIEQAAKDDAPVLHERVGSNVISDRHFRYGETQGRRRDDTHPNGANPVAAMLTDQLVKESAKPDPSLPMPSGVTVPMPSDNGPGPGPGVGRGSTNPVASAMTDKLVRESSKVGPTQGPTQPPAEPPILNKP